MAHNNFLASGCYQVASFACKAEEWAKEAQAKSEAEVAIWKLWTDTTFTQLQEKVAAKDADKAEDKAKN